MLSMVIWSKGFVLLRIRLLGEDDGIMETWMVFRPTAGKGGVGKRGGKWM